MPWLENATNVLPNSLRVDISLCFCISFKLEVRRFLVLAVKTGYCAVSSRRTLRKPYVLPAVAIPPTLREFQ